MPIRVLHHTPSYGLDHPWCCGLCLLPWVYGIIPSTDSALINIISKVQARVHGIINMADDGGLTYLRWRQQSLYHC